jgi:hypothetical protein
MNLCMLLKLILSDDHVPSACVFRVFWLRIIVCDDLAGCYNVVHKRPMGEHLKYFQPFRRSIY